MEAIAHSPSFAKKVHIPQSVGKDYAAADKGKTFKRGGDMNSKMKMFEKSGKDIEKKGMKEGSKADMALDKKQMMKAGGKVRRMAGGGMGDPFDLSDTDRENYAKNGAENLKRLKGFFGFGDKEESKPPSSMTMDIPPSGGGRRPLPTVGASTSRVSNQSPRTRRDNEDTSDSDAVERSDAASRDKTTKGPQFTGSLNGGFEDNAPAQRESKVGSGASGFNQTPYQDSGFSALDNPPVAKRKPRTVSVEKNKTKVTTSNKIPAAIDSEKLLKDAEEDVLRKKPTAMTEQMRKAPTINDLYAGQKSMSEDIGDMFTNFRNRIREGNEKGRLRQVEKKVETNAKGGSIKAQGGNVKRMRYGGSPDDGMDMGQPMRGMAPTPAPRGRGVPMAAAPAPMNPNSIAALEAQYGTKGPQGGNPMLRDPRMKAGGSVKKMAEGGFTREADGVAKKGKTQGKVVKMAGGGFVKTADGCAQRGKTKAFQVKMNRGGKC
jgi:hypothetical protein